MKTKKFWALIMALAMTLALALPAFAEDTTVTTAAQAELTGAGAGKSGAINVTLPPVGTLVLNPYQMKAVIGTGDDAVSSYHQVFFKSVACVNKSTFGLKVGVKVMGTPSTSAVNLVSTAPKDTATEKDVFLYAEFGVSDSATAEPVWETSYNKTANQLVLSNEYADAPKVVATLTATNGATNGNGEALNETTGKWNYLWYKFDGSAAKSPSTAWATADNVTPKVAFTFTPTVDTVYAVTLTNTTSKTAAGTAKISFDLAPAGETITVTCVSDEDVPSTPTVTAKQGTTSLTVNGTDGEYTFTMPAGDVAVTVKWVAAS